MIHATKMPNGDVDVQFLGSYEDLDSEVRALESGIKDYKETIKQIKEELQ